MKRLLLLFLFIMLPLSAIAEKRWIDIDMELKTGVVVNKVKDGWRVDESGSPAGLDKDFTYQKDVASATPSGWRGDQEEIFTFSVAGRATEKLTFDTKYELIGNYADRLWQPISDQKRMELSGSKLKWIRGQIDYSDDFFQISGFRGVGHGSWSDTDFDMFGFYPEQWEIDKYRRVSSKIIPIGGRVNIGNSAYGNLTYITGEELIWGYGLSQYAKYNKKIGRFNTTLFYKREDIPYGDEEEKLNAYQLSTKFAVYGKTKVQLGLLFQPFRMHRAYQYIEEVNVGAGLLGSSYKLKTNETDAYDAWGEAATITFFPRPVVDTIELGIKHLGLIAGNKDEFSINTKKSFLRKKLNLSVGFVSRKPLEDPVPLLKDQVGSILASPRGEDSPFRVTEDPEVSLKEGNREKNVFDFVFTFDPTPRTWFYQWRDGIVEEWNINPAEDAVFASAFKCSLTEYPGSTDNVPYYNEEGNLTFMPVYLPGLPPSRGYMPSFNWIGVVNLPGKYTLMTGLGGGQIPASTIIADENGKNYTNYLSSLVSVRRGSAYVSLVYERDTWGPEDFHRDFGFIIDRLLRSKIGYDFGDSAFVSGEYIYSRRIENLTRTFSLGSFDEFRFNFGFRFGALLLIDERERTVYTQEKKELAGPEARIVLEQFLFSPDDDKVNDTVSIRLEVLEGSIKSWAITIIDDMDQVVMQHTGRNKPPAHIVWDGVDQNFSETVGEGTYTVNFRVTDNKGNNGFAAPVDIKVVY